MLLLAYIACTHSIIGHVATAIANAIAIAAHDNVFTLDTHIQIILQGTQRLNIAFTVHTFARSSKNAIETDAHTQDIVRRE